MTPSKPSSPYEQLSPLPTPCFKMFLERSLNDPPPSSTPLQASFTFKRVRAMEEYNAGFLLEVNLGRAEDNILFFLKTICCCSLF